MADEKSGETTDGVSVVVVDQPDRHKAYRSSEVTEVHRKRSKAPAVPLVAVTDVVPAQEKDATTEKVSKHGKKDLKSSTPEKEDEVVPSEKHHKHHDAKKSASCKSAPSGNLTIDNTKKKESVVMHSSATVPQPIPARLPDHTTAEEHKKEDQKDLIEEEPPSAPQEVKAASGKAQESNTLEAVTSQHAMKKGVSWNTAYENKVKLQGLNTPKSEVWPLCRKASIGPYRKQSEHAAPSGITLYLPKKSVKSISEDVIKVASGISITISRKSALFEQQSTMKIRDSRSNREFSRRMKIIDNSNQDNPTPVVEEKVKMLEYFRSKIDNMCVKIRRSFM